MEERDTTNFSIINNTNSSAPTKGVPFINIKERILGIDYILSLVFINNAKSEELNEKYRKGSGPTNVLSFSLRDNEGEVFINLDDVDSEHREFNRSPEKFIAFLFIHALFHLKGFNHGSKMENEEEQIRREFLGE